MPCIARTRLRRDGKKTVMMADDFVERVLHGLQEVVVGSDDIAFRGELDHRHGATDCRQHAFFFVLFIHPCSDVGSHFDHALDLLVRAIHRHVTGFEPDFPAGLVQTQKSPADRLTASQVTPQSGVLFAAIESLFTKHPMMFATHFIGAVAHGFAEVFIGIENDALRGELDHGHRTADRFQLGVGLGQGAAESLDLLQVSLVM